MRKNLILTLGISILVTACTSAAVVTPASTSTPEVAPVNPAVTESVELSTVRAPQDDFFTENGITRPAPTCSASTVAQTEGPYYMPNTPEWNDLFEEGMPGTRLIVVGYVLDSDCKPLSNVWLDFWQANANGEYDNSGYTLRGHQFTDSRGRYYLQTVVPGEYPGRTEHIHVKIQSNGGSILTTQLYFPNVPANTSDGIFDPTLIVQLEERPNHVLAYFNFVMQ